MHTYSTEFEIEICGVMEELDSRNIAYTQIDPFTIQMETELPADILIKYGVEVE